MTDSSATDKKALSHLSAAMSETVSKINAVSGFAESNSACLKIGV